jgi:hypothetical protein
MARGGFISPMVFLRRAYAKNISLIEAKMAVVEALRLECLECRGKRFSSSGARRAQYKRTNVIPSSVWVGLPDKHLSGWKWEIGRFVSRNEIGGPLRWDDVSLNERQCNELIDRLQARLPPPSESLVPAIERRRSISWDEWVAAVATLAYEQAINPECTDKDILDMTARRLGIHHEPSKVTKRMKTAAQAIVDRWKRTPPARPAPTTHPFTAPIK